MRHITLIGSHSDEVFLCCRQTVPDYIQYFHLCRVSMSILIIFSSLPDAVGLFVLQRLVPARGF